MCSFTITVVSPMGSSSAGTCGTYMWITLFPWLHMLTSRPDMPPFHQCVNMRLCGANDGASHKPFVICVSLQPAVHIDINIYIDVHIHNNKRINTYIYTFKPMSTSATTSTYASTFACGLAPACAFSSIHLPLCIHPDVHLRPHVHMHPHVDQRLQRCLRMYL